MVTVEFKWLKKSDQGQSISVQSHRLVWRR